MAPDSRRSSFLTMGGANSLSNFASSHQRAAMYHESALVDVSPCTSAESPLPDLEDGQYQGHQHQSQGQTQAGQTLGNGQPLDYLGQNLGNSQNLGSSNSKTLKDFSFPVPEPGSGPGSIPGSGPGSIPGSGPGSSPGSTRGTGFNETSSLLSRKHRSSSVFSLVPHSGTSTAPQTISNAVNTLMGIAMLSLSFGLRLSGWVLGVAFFLGSAYITASTAKILGSILSRHIYCNSYGDIAHLWGGPRFKALATATFTVDLLGASLTLILLFSDASSILFPGISPVLLKLLIVSVTFFISFLPLSVVSIVSLLGIVCTVGIMTVIAICGFSTPTSPGSLLHPEHTRLWPSSFKDLLFSLGIFMAPWGGHPVYPELYRDMRHPAKYASCCNWSFAFTTFLDSFIAVVGYLMYGDGVSDSLTKSILQNTSSAWVNRVVCLLVGLLPISKLVLTVRPLLYVVEEFLESHKSSDHPPKDRSGRPDRSSLVKICSRLILMTLLLILSLAFTQFGQVVAFLGSAICCTICVTFPLMFHLKLNAHTLTPWCRFLTKIGIFLGIIAAILGTYGAIASDHAIEL